MMKRSRQDDSRCRSGEGGDVRRQEFHYCQIYRKANLDNHDDDGEYDNGVNDDNGDNDDYNDNGDNGGNDDNIDNDDNDGNDDDNNYGNWQ